MGCLFKHFGRRITSVNRWAEEDLRDWVDNLSDDLSEQAVLPSNGHYETGRVTKPLVGYLNISSEFEDDDANV